MESCCYGVQVVLDELNDELNRTELVPASRLEAVGSEVEQLESQANENQVIIDSLQDQVPLVPCTTTVLHLSLPPSIAGSSAGGVSSRAEGEARVPTAAPRPAPVHSEQCPEAGLQGPVPEHQLALEWNKDSIFSTCHAEYKIR